MGELVFVFDAGKTAQAIAFLLKLSPERKISKGHLVKMLYGADKRNIRMAGMPITGDIPYSLPDGPILSHSLHLLNREERDELWLKHFSEAKNTNHLVHLIDENIDEDLLSETEKESLRQAWKIFGAKSWTQVKEFCHDPRYFPEWEDPGDSRKIIHFETIYKLVNRSDDMIEDIKSLQAEDRLIGKLFDEAKNNPN